MANPAFGAFPLESEPSGRGFHSLRLLLWLKWVLTWRGVRRTRVRLIGIILLLCIFAPLGGSLAIGLWFLYKFVTPSDAALVTRDVLALLFVIWVVTPLFGFQLNESFDITKLFVYPVSLGRLFVGVVLGGMLDLPAVFALPTLGVIAEYYTHNLLGFVLVFAALLGFFLHTLAIGQAFVLTQVGFLRSRRYRDISIIVFPMIGVIYTVVQNAIMRQFWHGPSHRFFDAPLWRIFDWLAPGFCARILEGVRTGSVEMIVLGSALLLVAGCVSVALAVWSLGHLYFGDVGPQQSTAGESRTLGSFVTDPGVLRFLPIDVAAMTAKEIVTIEREPQYKMLVIQLMSLLAVVSLPFFALYTGVGLRAILAQHDAAAFFSLSSLIMFWMMPLIFNHYAGEGAAITVLFSLPTRRRTIILGKNLAHYFMMVLLNWVGLTCLSALIGLWAPLPIAALLVLGCGPILLAVGNLASIYLPHRMISRGNRPQPGGLSAADGTGCLYALLYMLAYVAALVLVSPIFAAVVVPYALGTESYYPLTLPIAFAYSALLYIIFLGDAERRLMLRESEIAAQINPTD